MSTRISPSVMRGRKRWLISWLSGSAQNSDRQRHGCIRLSRRCWAGDVVCTTEFQEVRTGHVIKGYADVLRRTRTLLRP